MSWDLLKRFAATPDIENVYELAVLCCLCDYCRKNKTQTCPEIKMIMGYCRMKERKTKYTLKSLEEKGIINRQRRPNATDIFTLLVTPNIEPTNLPDMSP